MRRPGRVTREALRPRERLVGRGAAALHEAELVALVLGAGDRQGEAEALARGWLGQFADAADPTGLTGLLGASTEELAALPGAGPVRSARLRAVREIAHRLTARALRAPRRVRGPEDAWRHLAPLVAGADRERFALLCLNRKHGVLRAEVVAVGSLEAVVVHPREVFRPAVRAGAAAVVVAHNHPSGDPAPSPEDHALTRRLAEAGVVLGIPLLDHLVIGRAGFVSLCEAGPASGAPASGRFGLVPSGLDPRQEAP
ncbi:MAG: DNA repair protein RadC [Candidatus Sericytochromatia bacterium]|nr:DNA repair protein RadC [Candidatus Sericytochromatia bacterium]